MLDYILHSDKRLVTFLFLFLAVLFLLISPDAYFHGIFSRCDSGIFYMCGKAWMNGMTPYVDFSDSKGPYLWLFYGIGYLLARYSMVGVYWLFVVSYTGVYYLNYKSARVLGLTKERALICTLLMTFSYFYRIHSEFRAEDVAQLFIVLSFYQALNVLWAKGNANRASF